MSDKHELNEINRYDARHLLNESMQRSFIK
jgi:hypothetical protein